MKPFYPLLIALQFLTRFPVRLASTPAPRLVGRSLLYYPLVGLLLGLVLAALHCALASAPALLRAALLLSAWVVLTGALHLDGLADSTDAWIGGLGNRTRSLAIMKDPYCGPMAVVALMLVLLIKCAALSALESNATWLLVAIPTLARSTIPLLFLTTAYVRPGGSGAALAKHMPRAGCTLVVALTWTLALIAMGLTALWLLLALGSVFIVCRHMMIRRLGGTTGDTAGALVELTESALLVVAVLT